MASESEEVELEPEPENEPEIELEPELETELKTELETELETEGGEDRTEDLWAKLPDEVQQRIFRRLRWRSLFRVCAVSKSFNDGINRYVHELPLFRTAVSISKCSISK